MADMIQCPLCGTDNPSTQKVCQRCQTPLSLEASFQPGQAPKHTDTGELEPILPQWLQDARKSSKQNEPDESARKIETPAQPAASPPDFLAGLQSQAGDDDEEEVPDWLASITGTTVPKQKADEAETGGVRWVETGKKDDFLQAGSFSEEEDEVPSWLAGIQTPQIGADEKDELTDWFRESSGEGQTFQPEAQQPSQRAPAFDKSFSVPASDETPDWLKQMAAEAGEKPPATPSDSSIDSSDWFNQASADANAAVQNPEFFTTSGTPDWLSQMQADANASTQEKTPEPFNLSSETPDWLNQMQADAGGAAQQEQTPEPFNVSSETPDWLSGLGGASAPFAESTPADSEAFESAQEVPAWLASDEQEASQKVNSTPDWLQDQGDALVGTPAWLASNEATLVQPTADAESETSAQDDFLSDLPDWLKSAAPQSSLYDEPAEAVEIPKAEALKPSSPFEDTSAFEKDSFRSEGSEGLFTEMPDWLSNAMDAPATPSMPEPITGSDALAPDVLPSWVEAMRPSDQGMANIVAASNDSTESRGALAGLSGVLPAGVGFNPTSKPKAYSIKLNASEEQLKHAGILEQILAAETAPQTLASENSITASRGLRWTITLILLVAAFTTIFLRTQFFSMPVGVPNELKFAVAVSQAIPPNSPVLVAVDYEAARVGEMEAASAPLFDNLILLKQPRLIFIASNETGAILSERLIAGQVAVHGAGVNALNLGYLSGGQMGIRAFAQTPSVVAPLDVSGQPAWALPQLEGVTALNQFAAIILVTDNADAARSWVEQTQDTRGAVPIIVISSAQAAPMIQPYYDSGQVAGMVSGLYGGAIFERQYNSGRPGTARAYWDAYSIGMLLAMILLVGGGFINLALGLRDRAALRAGK